MTFNRTPNDATWEANWNQALSKQRCSRGNLICYRHFGPEDLLLNGTKLKLKRNAIPTIFDVAKGNGSVDVDANVDVGIDISGIDIGIDINESQCEWQILKSELLETIRSLQIQLQDQNDLLKSKTDQIETLNDMSTNKSDQINTKQIEIQELNDQVREECRKNQYLSEEIQVLKDRLGEIQQSCRSNLTRFAMDATTSTNSKV